MNIHKDFRVTISIIFISHFSLILVLLSANAWINFSLQSDEIKVELLRLTTSVLLKIIPFVGL